MNFFDPPRKASPPPISGAGKLVSWEDTKGFGWVESKSRRHFAHIKEFERGQRRPTSGEEVTFVAEIDEKGRSCAKSIRFVRQGGQVGRVGFCSWGILALFLVLPLLALGRLPFPIWSGPSWLLIASLITYGFYASDKARAQAGKWRIPENQLHFFELLGGWPGAWIAQRRLRHKVIKGSYQFVFWLILILYQLVSADCLTGGKGARQLMAWIGRTWHAMP